ncbi:MAG: helix-turn-helix domain-containing protein [Bacilli bacterium]|nr:helix-turn-helix domain-containing protein [Bacilli bacterium]
MNVIIYESHHDKNKDLKVWYSKNSNINPHFHRSYELLYIVKGILQAEIGDKSFIAEPGDFVFVNKYYTHAYKSIDGYEKYVMIIPPYICNDFESIFKDKTLPPLLADKEFNKSLYPILKSMKDKFNQNTSLVKKGYVNVIIGELLNHYKLIHIKKNNNIELLMNILDYIDQNYKKDLDLEIISMEMGYSKYYVSRLFNTFIGQNINNYLNMVRVEHAYTMINSDDKKNISEIALMCGFNSLPTFYRCYKKVYGIHPSQKDNI